MLDLPVLRPCGHLKPDAHDALVTAAGFEDRALAVLGALAASRRGRAAILVYKEHDPRDKIADLTSGLKRKGFRIRREDLVEYDRYRPDSFADRLASWLAAEHARNIILDITCMSRMAILLSLDVCRQLGLAVTLFYTEAKAYAPSRQAYERARDENSLPRPSIQIYTGVGGVVRAARLSSVSLQGEPSAAIAFMSFNELLTQALVNAVYPSRLLLVNGRPPKQRWREEATAWIHEDLLREWPERDNPLAPARRGSKPLPSRVTSTLRYSETTNLLLRLYWDLAVTHRIVIAPTGSKMQTVGCFLVKAIHPDCHIEYPTPKGFLSLYSKGIGSRWIVRFSKLDSYIESMRRAERLDHLSVLGS